MTIANLVYEGMGAHVYAPEGPYGATGQPPLPSQAFGTVMKGNAAGEFVFCQYAPTTAVTYNQGDFFFIDQNYFAYPVLSGSAQYATPIGTPVGALFLGGRVGDVAADTTGNIWSFAFGAGNLYGIWLQRSGQALGNFSVVTHQYSPVSTTSTAGSLATPTAASHYSTVSPVAWNLTSVTATCNANSGSTQLTSVTPALGAAITGIAKGMYASGTSVPNGAYVVDVNGTNGSVTLSAAVTANISSGTITFSNNVIWGVLTSGSPLITGVQSLPGVYPNQTLSGTGVASNATIMSISGKPGAGFTITMSANATASETLESITTSGYYETTMVWPTVASST